MRACRSIVAPLLATVIALGSAPLAASGSEVDRSSPREQERPPNVVLLVVDDLGWQDTSLALHAERTPFNERYRTPNLERLAARGVRFTDAYAAAPVCTPTRVSILTGMAPARLHVTFWTLHQDRDTSKAHPTLAPPAWNMNGVQRGAVTLPGLLREAGYRTIHVGKAHFGAHGTSGADPTNLGFDVNVAGHASGGPASYYGKQSFSLAGREGRPGASVWDIPGLERYHGQDIYLTEALALEAVEAVEDAVAEERPFYLHFAPYAVHAPIMANRRYLDAYLEREPDLDAREAAYATMIESVDAALGSIVAALERLGVAEDTVIIYTSDNGGLSAHARGGPPHVHNAPLRSGKGSAYDGGTRVPQVIAGPGVEAHGVACAVPVTSTDLFPTILGFAGVSVPADHAESLDGVDLAPLLRVAPEPFDAERVIGWHQPHQWGAAGPGIEPFTAVRSGRWKLIWFHADGRRELYDLAEDIGESRDLADARPEVLSAMTDQLRAWITGTGAQLSIDRETGAPIDLP